MAAHRRIIPSTIPNKTSPRLVRFVRWEMVPMASECQPVDRSPDQNGRTTAEDAMDSEFIINLGDKCGLIKKKL